jgi:peroxiredoxin Q/BCP
MLKPGDMAPEFTLISEDGETVSLSDYRGKSDVILYFYPKDNTSGCTKDACSFRDNVREIETKGAVVLGISPDSVRSHQNFARKHELNFTLLSDPDHKVAQAWGVWGEKKMYGRKYWGILRTTFIIDKDGIIRDVFQKVKPAGHAEQILAFL